MKALIFGLSTALVTLVPYWISEPVSATGIAQYINPFNSDGGVTVRGNASRTLTSSASIFSPLLGPVTRTIAGTKTGGSRVPALEAFVDASVNRFYFDTGIGVLGHAPIDYGTFAAKDFTVAGMADKFLLDIETLLVESRDPLSVTGLTVRFDFTDSDGTTGTLSQTFKETISNPQRLID
jgi:hypothetical protein